MDDVLCAWQHLFQEITPDILCMRTLVPNLFLNSQRDIILEVSMKSVVDTLYQSTNGKYFKGIDMFLVPICEDKHYFLCTINMAKNEVYMTDGFNQDQLYEHHKKYICKEYWM